MNFKKLVFVIAFLGILAGGFFANAQPAQAASVEELIALIAQLKAQIVQLQQQLQAQSETTTAWCHNFNTNLRIGDVGEDTTALQVALQKEGLIDEEISSNEFEERVASAVVGFQERYKNEVLTPYRLARGTGFVGKSTRAKLNSLYGCNGITPTQTPTLSPTTTIPTPTQTPTPVVIPPAAVTPTTLNQSSIAVLSPNGGESLSLNTTYPVKINVPLGNQYEISFNLYQGSTTLGSLAGSRPSETIFNWTVGQYKDLNGNTFTAPAGQSYRIALIIPSQSAPVDFSDNYFSIGSVTTTPVVSLTCDQLKEAPASHSQFDSCKNQGFDKVCFNKYNYEYQGCGKSSLYNDCTIQNVNAEKNIWCDTGLAYTGAPEMVYPSDGQVLNYGYQHGYMFKVKQITGATAYRYQFFQNGSSIYDNLNSPSTNGEFAVWPGDSFYSNFQEGNVSVWIRALVNGQWTDARTISIILGRSNLYPTPITTPYTMGTLKTGDKVFFDSGVGNKGPVTTGIFNIKWFVDGVQMGYGSHSGVAGNSTAMDGNSQFTWAAVEGTHTIKFVVDADNHVVNEVDEANNAVSTTITVSPVVVSSSITVLTPNGGNQLQKGSTQTISWTSSNVSGVYIKLRKGTDTYSGVEGVVSSTIPNAGSYQWTMPTTLPDGNDYSIRVVDSTGSTYDDSDANFSIVAAPVVTPSITVLSPNGGETWQIGSIHDIAWISSGLPANAMLSTGINGDGQTSTMAGAQIATNIPASNGIYSWTIPSVLGETLAGKKYSVYATCINCSNPIGYASENYFSIVSP